MKASTFSIVESSGEPDGILIGLEWRADRAGVTTTGVGIGALPAYMIVYPYAGPY
jgi:hypothetical protein